MADKILVITGPTASGKTALSEILAEKFGGEIVGADSMQIYRHMDIGTAKPTSAEMGDTPHHTIAFSGAIRKLLRIKICSGRLGSR